MTTVALVAHWDWVLFNFRLGLARSLKEAGAEVVLVSPPGEFSGRFESMGFRWARWDVERSSINLRRELPSVVALSKLYRRLDLSLVHHFTIKPIVYGAVASRVGRVPVVFNSFSGLGYLYTEDKQAGRLRALVELAIRHGVDRKGSTSIVLNGSDRDRLLARRLVAPERLELITEGVDIEAFQTPPHEVLSAEEPVIVMAARLLWEKGVKEFVDAARMLRDRGVHARFIVAGAPDRGNPSSVPDSDIERWNEEGLVEFLGYVEDVPSLLSSAAIAVLPTYYPEGLPRFLLEAGASGLAQIATDIPGCNDIVLDERSGLLVPPRDVARLADALQRLIVDVPLRLELGRGARERVRERYSEDSANRRLLDSYRRAGLAL